jgi:hypothetical protein
MGNFFVGSRSHNFHGIYGYSGGVFLEGRTFFESNPVHEFVAGAQIDVMLMALPAIAFINLFR